MTVACLVAPEGWAHGPRILYLKSPSAKELIIYFS